MSTSIYLAAPWVRREDAREALIKFEEAGLEVTARWINVHPDTPLEGINDRAELVRQASEDLADIMRSDVFVILNLELSEGKATELGVAYALGVPVLLVGERSRNIFYHLPGVHRVDSVEEAIEAITSAVAKAQEGVLEGEVINGQAH